MKSTQRRRRPASRSRLTLNRTEPAALVKNVFQSFTFNLKAAKGLTRNEQLEGIDYVVVPMVMITEGVHAGSKGPLFYPGSELGKTPESWNLKPIVVNHPVVNGEGVSACTPEVIEEYKVGIIMNTRFDGLGRLKADAYINPEQADKVEPRVMEAITNEEMMELSTGVFTDQEPTTGKYKGESYTAIARNYRPDHLALLPDNKGACSIEDGAGFIRNQLGQTQMSDDQIEKVRRFVTEALAQVLVDNKANPVPVEAPAEGADDDNQHPLDQDKAKEARRMETVELQRDLAGKFSNQASADATTAAIERSSSAAFSGTSMAHKAAASAHRAAAMASRKANGGKNNLMAAHHDGAAKLHDDIAKEKAATTNDLSYDDTRGLLYKALAAKLGCNDNDVCGAWITEVYDDCFIYSYQNTLYRQKYFKDDTSVTLVAEPEAVVRVTSYELALNRQGTQTQINMNKDQMIADLIKNHGWKKEDAESLKGLSDGQVKLIHNNAVIVTKNSDLETDGGDGQQDDNQDDERGQTGKNKGKKRGAGQLPTGNAEADPAEPDEDDAPPAKKGKGKKVTANEYIEAAPPEVQAILRNGQRLIEKERKQLIATIVANENCPLTEEELATRNTEDLRTFAAMAGRQGSGDGDGSDEDGPFAGLGEVAPTGNRGGADDDEDEVLLTPTLNFNNEDEKPAKKAKVS